MNQKYDWGNKCQDVLFYKNNVSNINCDFYHNTNDHSFYSSRDLKAMTSDNKKDIYKASQFNKATQAITREQLKDFSNCKVNTWGVFAVKSDVNQFPEFDLHVGSKHKKIYMEEYDEILWTYRTHTSYVSIITDSNNKILFGCEIKTHLWEHNRKTLHYRNGSQIVIFQDCDDVDRDQFVLVFTIDDNLIKGIN
jgi:hypothetical protein